MDNVMGHGNGAASLDACAGSATDEIGSLFRDITPEQREAVRERLKEFEPTGGTESADATDPTPSVRERGFLADDLDYVAIMLDGLACSTEALDNSEDALPTMLYFALSDLGERVRSCSKRVRALA